MTVQVYRNISFRLSGNASF